MEVIHHGGKDTVTGSCHELKHETGSIFVDCGLFQGKDSRALAYPFSTKHVCALILTHAHIDHVGRIPWLLAAGFHGSIYCTPATAELVPLLLEDSLKVQNQMDFGQRERILELVGRQIKVVPYYRWERVIFKRRSGSPKLGEEYLYFRLSPAGHILGSAYVEVKQSNGKILLFSGDLGASATPLHRDPIPPKVVDRLFLESTYGDRNHSAPQARQQALEAIIQRSLQNGGVIIIPAFSVGRVQELLFDLEGLFFHKKLTQRLPIVVDSPMASKVTKFYRRYRSLWGREAQNRRLSGRLPLDFKQLTNIRSHQQHMELINRLDSTQEPVVIIAASGMCQGGRVINYLSRFLVEPKTDVVFCGYQAEGTLGRELQSGKSEILVDGKLVKVSARIHSLSGYSAHADQNDLIKFVQGIGQGPKDIQLVHGNIQSKQVLKALLEEKLDGVRIRL